MLNLSVPFPNHLDFCKLLSMPLRTATKVSWQASIVTKISTPLADGHTVAENTGSLLTSEVKRHRARLVLGWGTAWEDPWMLSAFCKRAIASRAKVVWKQTAPLLSP